LGVDEALGLALDRCRHQVALGQPRNQRATGPQHESMAFSAGIL